MKIEVKRVFIKDGSFSTRKPTSFTLEEAIIWPLFVKRAFHPKVGSSFKLWCQTQFGRVFKISFERRNAVRPLLKKVIFKFFKSSTEWRIVKSLVRKVLKLCEKNTPQAILFLEKYLEDQRSPFSFFNIYIKDDISYKIQGYLTRLLKGVSKDPSLEATKMMVESHRDDPSLTNALVRSVTDLSTNLSYDSFLLSLLKITYRPPGLSVDSSGYITGTRMTVWDLNSAEPVPKEQEDEPFIMDFSKYK
jgi:hypothetical protein